MSANPNILVSVTVEPPDFYEAKPDESCMSIHLAFDVKTKAQAETLLQLADMATWPWTLYRLKLGTRDTAVTVPDTEIKIGKRWHDARTIEGKAVAAWLADKRNVFENPIPFSVATPDNIVDPEKINAAGLLLGSVAWTAPVPHTAQLLSVIKLKKFGNVPLDHLFILPVEKIQAADDLNVLKSGNVVDRIELTVKSGGTFDKHTLITRPILWDLAAKFTLPTTVAEALSPTAFPVPVRKDGFLFNVRSEKDFRFLQTFEKIASSLFWSLPPLIDVIPEIAKYTPNQAAFCGLAVALDPLWISLLSPANGTREGTLLAPLMRIAERDNPKAVEPFLNWIRDEVSQLDLDNLVRIMGELIVPPEAVKNPQDEVELARKVTEVMEWLRKVAATLQQESGLEQVLDRLMIHLAGVGKHKGYDNWINEYRKFLSGPWNALDAVRMDFSHLLSVWLTEESRKSSSDLQDVVDKANPYTQRLIRGTNSWYEYFNKSVLALNPLDAPEKLLNKAWTTAVSRALGSVMEKPTIRFVPDRSPQPVPIAIAASPSGHNLAYFTSLFNGVAILLRRESEPWAHANLAALRPLVLKNNELKYDANWTPGKTTVKPFLPVSLDGRRESFIPYHGLPLASPAYVGTGGPGMDPVQLDPSANPLRQPFYCDRDVHFDSTNTFQKPPRLGYGFTYDVCAFAVSKAGAMPLALQDAKPWIPRPTITFTETHDVISTISCQRRTAIGTTSFGGGSKTSRIGAEYPNLFPLALDFPRVSLTAGKDSINSTDLFRTVDGVGQLSVPTKGKASLFTLNMHQLRIKPDDAECTAIIEVHQRPDVDWNEKALVEMPLDKTAFTTQNWIIEIVAHDGEAIIDPPATFVLRLPGPADPEAMLWIRLKFTSKADAAIWSFDPPQPHGSEIPGSHAATQPPILLVAAPDPNTWNTPFTELAEFDCDLSRTTWADWERWFNNNKLPLHGKATTSLWKEVADAFVKVSLMRGEDPSGLLSSLLDRVPDPAVSHFIVELGQVDSIFDNREGAMPAMVLEAPSWLKAGDVPVLPDNPSALQCEGYLKNLRALLGKMDRRFRFKVRVKDGAWDLHTTQETQDGLSLTVIHVTVPAGRIALLKVRPLIDQRLFATSISDVASPLVSGLKQLAQGTTDFDNEKFFVFPGAELTVESLFHAVYKEDEYHDILDKHLVVQCPAGSRTYRLLQPKTIKASNPWARCFSHLDLHTQRWRFSGRPIYQWLNPREVRKEPASTVAMELDFKKDKSSIADFETQLFFERDDLDCQVTRVRLLGGGTELAVLTWENPSATYYRHAFKLVSRYAGALRNMQRQSHWPPSSAPLPWNRRVVILADAERLSITCPQVRCLVPLSADPTKPGKDKLEVIEPRYPGLTPLAPSPPLLCVLEEKPFAVGGLADRIVPEALTGIGYGFEKGNDSVQPLDIGKEMSRDPRIDPRSWKHDEFAPKLDPSLGFVLEPEGPIGLHFEHPTVPAPAWTNCQYLLKPRSINGDFLPDESFLGVRLRRVLDPAWVMEPATMANTTVPLSRAWQATIKDWTVPNSPMELLSLQPAGALPVTLLECTAEMGHLVFHVNRQLLGKGYKAGLVVACAVPHVEPLPELCIHHLCQGDGHYTLSILAMVKKKVKLPDAVQRGESSTPLLLASVEWKTNDDLQLTTNTDLVFSAEFKNIMPLTVSQATLREFGRSAKNADWVHCMVNGECERHPTTTLQVSKKLNNREYRLEFAGPGHQSLWLVASLADSRLPHYIQRHLVAVFTRLSGGAGKQFDLYVGACLLRGRFPLIDDATRAEQATKLQLHELEVPAVIVAANVNDSFKEFKIARLELKAIGGSLKRRCRLHVRFANSAISMAEASKIKIVIKQIDENNKPSDDLVVVSCVDHTRAVDILIQDPTVAAFGHLTDGAMTPGEVKSLSPITQLNECIGVTLEAPGLDEIWADVSVLHLPAEGVSPGPDHFDFDWLFSTVDQPSSADRLSPDSLAQLTESQARLVSMSDLLHLT